MQHGRFVAGPSASTAARSLKQASDEPLQPKSNGSADHARRRGPEISQHVENLVLALGSRAVLAGACSRLTAAACRPMWRPRWSVRTCRARRWSVVVQEVGSTAAPRLAWQAEQPVNPASLMKLLTTYAALDLLGPAWTWTTPVWLQGTRRATACSTATSSSRAAATRSWCSSACGCCCGACSRLGVREIRGDIVLDRSALQRARAEPGRLRRRAAAPVQRAAPTRCC